MAKIIKRKSLESPLAAFTGKVSSHFVGVTEWGKVITAGAFALCVKRLVKFTPDERQSVYVCVQDEATEKLSARERERERKRRKNRKRGPLFTRNGKGPGVCVCVSSFVRSRGVCLLACSFSMS